MLGRKSFTREEIDRARAAVDAQLAAYDDVAATLGSKAPAALAALDATFFNNLLLAMDRPFVHRVRAVAGKDGNPVNEVELLGDAIMAGGEFAASTVIKLDPAASVSGIAYGETVTLTRDQFGRLRTAFFDELETRFLEP